MPKITAEAIAEFRDKNPDSLQTFDLHNVEIFAIGKWNGDKYVASDLDAMVQAFSETKTLLKPYLKLGHGSKQEMLGADQLPSAGWVENVRRVGEKLYADFKGIPKKVYQLMKVGGYRTRSCEIIWNYRSPEGKLYSRALKAVALLGGETPAVQTLDDALALYAACGSIPDFTGEGDAREYHFNSEREEQNMDPKDIRIKELETENKNLRDGELKKFSDKAASLETENAKIKADLKAATERADASETKLAEYAAEAEKVAITAQVDKLIADKKIKPSQKEAVYAMLQGAKAAADKKYSVGKKEQTLEEIVKSFFASASQIDVNTEEGSETGAPQNADLNSLAKSYAAKHKVDFEVALVEVAKEQDRQKAAA